MSLARSAFIFCIVLSLGNAVPFEENDNTFSWALSSRAAANKNSRTSGATFEENNSIPGVRSREGSLGSIKGAVEIPFNIPVKPLPVIPLPPVKPLPVIPLPPVQPLPVIPLPPVQPLPVIPLPPIKPILPLKDILQCATETKLSNSSRDPDIERNTKEILEAQGYQVETHKVQTKDGYILTLFRIPRGKDEGVLPTATKKAVLVNHGLLGSSAQWVIQKENKNLAMKLAEAGYDVWLNNHRGTSYSTEHVNLTQKDVEYWDFSWHEMGVYDVPAIIDYMLDVTKNSKIFYVGHSQGTTQFLIAMSEREEYNKKIEVACLLAPIAYLHNNPNNYIRFLAFLGSKLQYLTDRLLGGKLQGDALTKYFDTSIGKICEATKLTCPLCSSICPLFFGYDGPQIDYPRLNVMLSKNPDSASTKCAVHYAQSINHSPESFRQFDYMTPEENEKRYGPGITEPPTYDLSKVVAKVIGFYADNDNLGVPKDVAITMSKLGNSEQNELVRVDCPDFNHLDFAFGKDADSLVYNNVLEKMNSIN